MKAYEIVGMQKICSDVDQAMKRARNVAAPINAQRFDIQTPCQKTGSCLNCLSPDTVCCQFSSPAIHDIKVTFMSSWLIII